MNFRIAILLLVVWAFCIILASSCSTVPDPELDLEYNKGCTVEIELRNNTKFEVPEDSDNMVNAEAGCVKYYGAKACLVRFIKTGHLSYFAICRRN